MRVLLSALVALLVCAAPASAASQDLVISQVYGGGGNAQASHTNDFIELFNRGPAALPLDGLSLQYASATGTGNLGANSGQLTELSGTIQPGRYFLVQEAGGTVGSPLPAADLTDPTPTRRPPSPRPTRRAAPPTWASTATSASRSARTWRRPATGSGSRARRPVPTRRPSRVVRVRTRSTPTRTSARTRRAPSPCTARTSPTRTRTTRRTRWRPTAAGRSRRWPRPTGSTTSRARRTCR